MEDINLKNPFAAFNASLMNDDEILKYFIRPQLLFGRQASGIDLTGDTPIVIEGGRGTGKTMLLKWLSNEVRLKDFVTKKGNGKGFLNQTKYLGVYHRFDGPSLGSFTSRNTSDEAWETIFKHYFELVIGQRLVMLFSNLLRNQCIELNEKEANEINRKIVALTCPNASIELTSSNCFDSITNFFQVQLDNVFDFINCSALAENVKFSGHTLTSGTLIFGIPKLLQDIIPELKGKRIIILLDEYENLKPNQQKIVNTLVKHTKIPVTFRIGTRLRGFRTYDTLNEQEFLMEDADYRKIRFEDILLAHDKNYRKLLVRIAKKRLEQMPEFTNIGITDITQVLGNISPEEEARNIIFDKDTEKIDDYPLEKYLSKAKHVHIMNKLIPTNQENLIAKMVCVKNPLLDMVNLLLLRRGYAPTTVVSMFEAYSSQSKSSAKYAAYKDLYEKNKLALLFQLVSINRPKQKLYGGFDVYCMLSSGIIRNFLELCYQSFNIALFSDTDILIKDGVMPFRTQTAGAKIRAERYVDVIERIPEHGNEIRSLVIQLGAIFNSWQNDEVLSEPEVTHFCVDYNALSPRARNVIDSAVQWSVLQPKKDMRGKAPLDPLLNVYALNHILSPYFGISYRLRGRIKQFEKVDLEALMFGSELEKKIAREHLSKHNKKSILHRSKTIMDFLGGRNDRN